jgi:hypothetical protein
MDQPEEKTTAAAQQAAVAYGPDVVTLFYVYAIGRIEARFPRLSVEKEFAQVTGRADTAGLSDRQALQKRGRTGILRASYAGF